MEFNEKTGQMALLWSRTLQTYLLTSPYLCETSIFYPLCPSVFPCSLFSKPPWPLPFPTFGSCPKLPIISPVQCQNALPWHPTSTPMLSGTPILVCEVPWGEPLNSLIVLGLTLPVGLMTPVMHQGRGSRVFIWLDSSTFSCATGTLCVCGDELLIA